MGSIFEKVLALIHDYAGNPAKFLFVGGRIALLAREDEKLFVVRAESTVEKLN